MSESKSHILTSLAYVFFVAGIVIFLILARKDDAPILPPQQVEQPQPSDERISPAQPPPAVNENKRQKRRAKTRDPKQKAQMYEADGNSEINN